MKLNCEVRQASSNLDAKHYDTERIRKEYLVEKIMADPDSTDAKLIEQQLYDLALLSNKQLNAEEMTKFIQRSNEILMKVL